MISNHHTFISYGAVVLRNNDIIMMFAINLTSYKHNSLGKHITINGINTKPRTKAIETLGLIETVSVSNKQKPLTLCLKPNLN